LNVYLHNIDDVKENEIYVLVLKLFFQITAERLKTFKLAGIDQILAEVVPAESTLRSDMHKLPDSVCYAYL
jgi:hypothetical protein